MSEQEESKELVPSALPDDELKGTDLSNEDQAHEATLEKQSASKLQIEESHLDDSNDKKETDEETQMKDGNEDNNAPSATTGQDNMNGDFFDESQADAEKQPQTISGMTERSVSASKIDISGEIQDSEDVPVKASGSVATVVSRSMSKTRASISYEEMRPRIRSENVEDDDLIGFDMGTGGPIIVLDDIVEEEEQSIAIEEQKVPRLDREPYYERHDKAMAEISERKIRNLILQKKLAMYFKRKKMDYVTKETEWSYDQQNKYNKKLEAYGELMELDTNERIKINEEIREAKQSRDDRFHELNNMFKKMQNREAEIGYGLIYRKTGTPISDKLINRLIKRQYADMEQISSMRLTYIKLKEMVQEKLNAINDINEVAPGLFLADYEQLKTLNQSYADKIEEKDEELTRLRTKCGSTTQTLAHLREKTAALENDFDDLVQEQDRVAYSFWGIRGNLNHIKQQRDSYRHNISKIRDDSGLLTQPTLLRDMEKSLTVAKVLQTELDHLMREYGKREKHLAIIRQKIEDTNEFRRYQKSIKNPTSRQFNAVSQLENIYKRRPTLMIPVILDNEFECLKSIKPLTTNDIRKHNKL